MSDLNVTTTEIGEAEDYIEHMFERKGIDIDTSLPNFERNYIFLQERMDFSLHIKRSEMPVIEPKDMGVFKRKITSGHVDIFKPYASTALFPHEFTTKRGEGWLTLGLKDGSLKDDVLKAELLNIPARELKPIQSQIWLEVIVEGMLKFGVPKRTSRILKAPIIISSEYYIIDGHHRWAQVMLANPKFGMECLYVPLDILTLINMTRSYGVAIGNEPNL